MDFLWNGYGFRILKNIDYGMDMDLFSNPSGLGLQNSWQFSKVETFREELEFSETFGNYGNFRI